LPAVLLGGRKNSPQKIGWAQLLAASGLSGVAVDVRSEGDFAAALAFVRAHGRKLGIDGSRLCALGFSTGSVPWLLSATMRAPRPWLRCNVVYYGPLDSALNDLRADPAGIPPMLVVKAGRDENAGVNESIDRFAGAAQALHADVRVVTNPTARQGFDLGPRNARTRAIMRQTLRFLRARLARPLPLRDSCLSAADRGSALRFFAVDDTPLAGIMVGTGPTGIVLAHGSASTLCEWLPYARELAASGYRVLAYDASGLLHVHLDAEAAVEALRRAGALRVAVMGSSLGALAVDMAAASLPEQPNAVVSLSAPSSVGPLRGLDAVPRLRAPVLFMAAQDDQPFSDDARSLYAAAASRDKTLRIVPGSVHGVDLLQEASLRAFVWSFIAAHMH
jgi:dienelactone hydrolase